MAWSCSLLRLYPWALLHATDNWIPIGWSGYYVGGQCVFGHQYCNTIICVQENSMWNCISLCGGIHNSWNPIIYSHTINREHCQHHDKITSQSAVSHTVQKILYRQLVHVKAMSLDAQGKETLLLVLWFWILVVYMLFGDLYLPISFWGTKVSTYSHLLGKHYNHRCKGSCRNIFISTFTTTYYSVQKKGTDLVRVVTFL